VLVSIQVLKHSAWKICLAEQSNSTKGLSSNASMQMQHSRASSSFVAFLVFCVITFLAAATYSLVIPFQLNISGFVQAIMSILIQVEKEQQQIMRPRKNQ
jgi:hypothetical protein